MLRQLNELHAKHGLAAGPAQTPERADWTIAQGWERYTAEDHGVWKTGTPSLLMGIGEGNPSTALNSAASLTCARYIVFLLLAEASQPV